MSRHYTPEQLDKRNNSKWTIVQGILAPLQLLTFIISFILIIRYLRTGEGYEIANTSVLIKITLMWLITITGMIWEKEIYDQWFLAPEFFWEDLLNAVALFMHNLYFVAIWLGANERQLMLIMVIAYVSYLVNFAQFFYRGIQAHKQMQIPMDEPEIVEGRAI